MSACKIVKILAILALVFCCNTYLVNSNSREVNYSSNLNIVETALISELSNDLPEATIITNKDGSVIITWDEVTHTGMLNGKPYIKDTLIRKEGNYIFIIKNEKGHTRPYRFDIGHYYVVSEIKPTCLEEGCILHTCTNCGDSYSTDITLPTGHQFVTVTIPATCTEHGYVSKKCELCGLEYRSEIVYSSGHSYNAEIAKQASCVTSGERRLCCENCGEIVFTIIPPIGHEYVITDARIEKGAIHRTYTCKICHDTYTQSLGDQYEKVTSYVEFLFNKYSPYMWWVLIAVSGVWSIIIGVAIIIAHRHEDREKAKKMLVNYVIGLIALFAIVVACPYLVKGIAALIR